MARPFDENIVIVETESGDRLRCRHCDELLCDRGDPYKQALAHAVKPVTAANQLLVDPGNYVDDEMRYHEYYCPGCGAMLETEILLADRDPVADKELRSGAVED